MPSSNTSPVTASQRDHYGEFFLSNCPRLSECQRVNDNVGYNKLYVRKVILDIGYWFWKTFFLGVLQLCRFAAVTNAELHAAVMVHSTDW